MGRQGWSRTVALAVAMGLAMAAPAAGAPGTGSISGVVTDTSGAPVAGVRVLAYSARASFSEQEALLEGEGAFGHAETNREGRYTVKGLNAEDFWLLFEVPEESPLDLVSAWLGGGSTLGESTPVDVTSGATVEAVDAQLQPAGAISGVVTVAASHAPAVGVIVCASGPAGVVPPTLGSCSITGPKGRYTVTGLPAGELDVTFIPAEFALRYWDESATFAGATPVTVVPGTTLSGIDAALLPEAQQVEALPPGLEELAGSEGDPVGAGGGALHGVSLPRAGLHLRARRIEVARGVAEVELSCGGSSTCENALVLSKKQSERVGRRRVPRRIVLASLHVTIRAGADVTERLRLSSHGRSLLRAAHGTLHAQLQLGPLAGSAASAGSRQPVTLVRAHRGR